MATIILSKEYIWLWCCFVLAEGHNPLPEAVNDITFHYNTSDNFVPSLEPCDQYREPVSSQVGDTKDWGVSAYLWNDKVVARVNFYEATLENATAPTSGIFNRNHVRIFQWYGRLNRDSRRFDSYDNETGEFLFEGDGKVDPRIVDEFITQDPDDGLYYAGEDAEDGFANLQDAIDAQWPYLEATKAAREPLKKYVFYEKLIHSFNARFLPDGDVNIQWAGAIADTTDITSTGMEAEVILNPSKNWRIAFNAARQQVVLDNISPRLGVLVEDFLLPYMAEFGHLDWGNPTGTPQGATFSTTTSDAWSNTSTSRASKVSLRRQRSGVQLDYELYIPRGSAFWVPNRRCSSLARLCKRRLSDLLSRAKPNLSAHRGRGYWTPQTLQLT